jgi:hypothetical protein
MIGIRPRRHIPRSSGSDCGGGGYRKWFTTNGSRGFDTAEAYGPFANEELVGEALSPFREQRATRRLL